MRLSAVYFAGMIVLAAFVAAACGGGDGGSDSTNSTPVPANGDGAPGSDAATDAGALAASVADGWSATVVGEGIKPALALDGAGSPAIAYLFEDVSEGFVRFAAAGTEWEPESIVEGYFYGPIDLAFDPAGRPNIVYHDHQASEFQEELGDLTYALREGTEWQTQAVEDDGHDGWDSTLAIGADGVVRAAGVDPAQFGREDGVEYYELRDGEWQVTAIGSGPIDYEWNVSLAVGPDGLPSISYYDQEAADLVWASFDGDTWNLETVASEGDAGKFSSLVVDAEGRPHISYFEDLGGGSGKVLYAVRGDEGWIVEEVGTLDSVVQGMTGARRITSLALDGQGNPHVAFSDEGAIRYASRTDAGWEVEEIVTAGERPLGQLVSLKLDSSGTPHLAFFEVTNSAPLDGLIAYLTPE